MRKALLALPFVVALAAAGLAMPGGNGKGGCSDSDLATARALVDGSCDCATASSHGSYVSCSSHAMKAAVDAGTMSRACRRLVRKAVVRSTCGRPGFVTCCRTRDSGATACSVKSAPAACKAPHGGSACVASATSCADACSDTGCASPSGAFLD
jgi:hypothetical protein